MPNELVAPEVVAEEFLKMLSGKSVEEQRAIWYDMQTALGGFPASDDERNKFIKTGHI